MAVIGLTSFWQAAMIDDAVSWLYDNGYTIFSNTRDYQPTNYMRRDEAAKFFVKVAEGLGKTDYVKSASECTFSDLNDGHADLRDIVVKSCRLGIFWGHEGKFMPTRALTNSQALAVLLRITSGYEDENNVSYWADNYYVKAESFERLSQLPVLKNKEWLGTRGTVAQLVYNYYAGEYWSAWLPTKWPLYYEYDNWNLYQKPTYKFSLQFPSSWQWYTVQESNWNYRSVWFNLKGGWFSISIIEKDMRENRKEDPQWSIFTYLWEKNGNIFVARSKWEKEILSILESFKLE